MLRRTAVTAVLFLAVFAAHSRGPAKVAAKSICRGCSEIGMGCCFQNGAFHCC